MLKKQNEIHLIYSYCEDLIKVTVVLLLFVLVIGCSSFVKKGTSLKVCLKKSKEIKKRTIKVHVSDSELYDAYIEQLRQTINFHNKQVEMFNNLNKGHCK